VSFVAMPVPPSIGAFPWSNAILAQGHPVQSRIGASV
jgi:hypothetical protein